MGSCCGGQNAGEKNTQIILDPKRSSEENSDQQDLNDKATKIQAHIRGHQERKKLSQIKDAGEKKEESQQNPADAQSRKSILKQSQGNLSPPQNLKEVGSLKMNQIKEDHYMNDTLGANQHAPKDKVQLIAQIPDYYTEKTKQVLEKQEPFIYDQDKEEFKDLPVLGPYEFENGSVYEGQWKMGQRHGRGKQIWKDGSIYEGYWYNNVACGKGRLIHSDGDIYQGDWRDDKAHGHGRYIHMDGAEYIGEWEHDKQNGKGKEIWPDGASYEGLYFQGKKHGRGVFKWADGSIYEGEFYQNNISGQGEYRWEDGRKYIGEWKNNKMDGKGVFTWQDGRKYEGSYKDDKKHGYGVFQWPDGRIYKGDWQGGKQHGKGIYIGNSRVEKEGEWVDGKRIKWIRRGGLPVTEENNN